MAGEEGIERGAEALNAVGAVSILKPLTTEDNDFGALAQPIAHTP